MSKCSDPTTDARELADAEALLGCFRAPCILWSGREFTHDQAVARFKAALLAACIATVEGMDAHVAADDQSLFLWRDDILAALRAGA